MGGISLITWEEFRSLHGRFGLFHVAIQRGARNPNGCTELWNGMTLIDKHLSSQGHFPTGLELSWPATDSPPGSGSSESCVGPFPNQVPFKLGQRPHQMEDEFASGCRGIDLLRKADKLDIALFEIFE